MNKAQFDEKSLRMTDSPNTIRQVLQETKHTLETRSHREKQCVRMNEEDVKLPETAD